MSLSYFCPFPCFFSFILLNMAFTPTVMPMHSGKNGVPGPNQNIQHADPMPSIVLLNVVPHVMKPKRYGTHTSELTTTNTIANITAVRQSFKLVHIHTNGAFIQPQIFFKIPLNVIFFCDPFIDNLTCLQFHLVVLDN